MAADDTPTGTELAMLRGEVMTSLAQIQGDVRLVLQEQAEGGRHQGHRQQEPSAGRRSPCAHERKRPRAQRGHEQGDRRREPGSGWERAAEGHTRHHADGCRLRPGEEGHAARRHSEAHVRA